MRNDGGSGWMSFTARQTIALTECAFKWRARTGPLGLVSVRDSFENGRGRLNVSALGFIPIARAAGSQDVTRGELMRYLAELAWAPAAILLNRQLRWRVIDDRRLIVSAEAGGARAEVELTLDGEGRIESAFAPDRPRAIEDGFVPAPWRGRFSDYRQVGTAWIPFAGEVGWVGDPDEIVWQGRIESWELR